MKRNIINIIFTVTLALFCSYNTASAQVKAGDIIRGTVSDDIEPIMMANVTEMIRLTLMPIKAAAS